MAKDEMNVRLERLIDAYKIYFEAKLEALAVDSQLRFNQMMQGLTDFEKRHATSVLVAEVDRQRIIEDTRQRFIEQDRATLLVEAKNEIRFSALEGDTQTIMATYALRDNIDKETLLAKQGVDQRFDAFFRERDDAAKRFSEAMTQLMQAIDKTDFIAKERILALTQHTDAQVESQEVATRLVATTVDIRFTNIDRATTLANDALEKRLEGINEFREQLRDQAARFVTREESESKLDTMRPLISALQTRIVELEKATANGEGRVWAFGVIVTLVSIAVSIGLHFVK